MIKVGLDTTSISSIPYYDTSYNYYLTSISANNEFLLVDMLNENYNSELLVYTEVADYDTISLYLSQLGREHIDILFLSPYLEWTDDLNRLLEEKLVMHIGVGQPDNIGQLEKFKPEAILLNLCPYNYDKEVIDWARQNGATIFSTNPFGGESNAKMMIDTFTTPCLLEFAAQYSDVVLLSGRELHYASYYKEYLESLEEFHKDFGYKKSIQKLPKKPNKASGISLIIEPGRLELPCGDYDVLYAPSDFKMSFGKDHLVHEAKELSDPVEIKMAEMYDVMKFPNNDRAKLFLLRHKAIELMEKEYKLSQGWEISVYRAGSNMFLLTAEKYKISKRWFSPDIIEIERKPYIIYYSNGEFVFEMIQNANEKPEEP